MLLLHAARGVWLIQCFAYLCDIKVEIFLQPARFPNKTMDCTELHNPTNS